jgi:hypothetical protein
VLQSGRDEDSVEFDAKFVRARWPTDSGAHDAFAIEDESGRRLKDMESAGDVGPVSHVKIHVADVGVFGCDVAEDDVCGTAWGAHLS